MVAVSAPLPQDGPVCLSAKDIERLGRCRPASFRTIYVEIGFVASLLTSMIMGEFLISGFNIILPELAGALDIPAGSRTWPASVFSLVTSGFLLPMARLGDMWGPYYVFNGGLIWLLIWTLVAGFSKNYIMLIVCRALQGLGPAAFLPTGIMMLGSTYRPGPRKNLIFSLYGAAAPLGFFFGIFIAGIAGQFLTWKWYFYLGSIVLFITVLIALFSLPRDRKDLILDAKMDWWSVATIIPGLILVVFAFTDGGHAPNGWSTPYIYVTFIAGMLFLAAAVYVEGWVAEQPLLPPVIFKPKYMKLLLVTLCMSYGVFGVYLFYSSFYIELVMHASTLLTTAWFAPMAVGGMIIATVGGFTLHLLSGRILLLISGTGNLVSCLMFAIHPENGTYWAYIFPAMICATIGIDITYNVSNIFITTSLPRDAQGPAGAVIHSLVFLGISFFLGIADLVVAENEHKGLAGSYKTAFWLGVGLSGAALVGYAFIKIGSAKSELTYEEKMRQAEAEATLSENSQEARGHTSVLHDNPQPVRTEEV